MMVVGAVLSTVVGRHPFERRDGDLIGQLPVVFAGLGAVPVIAGFAAIREQAGALAGTDGELAEAVLALRRLLSRSLNALGLLVALATLHSVRGCRPTTDLQPRRSWCSAQACR
jgi:hypothetical protein